MPIIGLGGNEPPRVLQKGGPVKRYDVEINGVATTLQLTDEDAKARGLTAKDEVKSASKQAAAPANKSRTPSSSKNKGDDA